MIHTTPQRPARTFATMLVAGLSLLLTGCFITPGKFTSELVLGDDDDFSFSYNGEIFFLGLAQLSKMGGETFEEQPCYVDATDEERPCTANELSGQRAEWEAKAEERAEQSKQMSAMMGGIDPDDPEARSKLVKMLLRQKGWKRVEDKGNGVFDVSYAIEGKAQHDFLFPLIEGVPATNPFVQIIMRKGGVMRIDAPGFAAQNDNNPFGAMMGGFGALAGMAALAPEEEGSANPMPDFPEIEGTFTVKLSGAMEIRANNTDEGPQATEGGQQLTWEISPRTRAAPTALIAK